MEKTFKPAWWLRSPHLQTLWSSLFHKQYALDYDLDTVELGDGDFIDLCWSRVDTERIVLILHGLEGSFESRNMNGLFHHLEQAGFRPVLMHFRGCSGRINRLPRAYHSGDTADVAEICEYIQRKTGRYPYAAVGVSLGGNVLLKWLGESGEDNPLERAVAISVPFRLQDAANRLDSGWSRLYRHHLLSLLKRSYLDKAAVVDMPIDVDVRPMRSFWEYDDKVTAALHGFDGVDDYYVRSSSRQYLNGIRKQTCIIHARDDPFMYPDTVPEADELSECIEMVLTDKGGHVGFIASDSKHGLYCWSEQCTVEFLKQE